MTEIETIKEANCAQRIIDMGKIDLEYIRCGKPTARRRSQDWGRDECRVNAANEPR